LLAKISSDDNFDINSCFGYLIDHLKKWNIFDKHDKTIFLIDYLKETLFTHFNLYRHFLHNERENSIRREEKQFLAPGKKNESNNDTDLRMPKPYSIWEYEKKISELEDIEKSLKEKYAKENSRLNVAEEDIMKSIRNQIRQRSDRNSKANVLQLDEEVF
jgi:hypothetical protein